MEEAKTADAVQAADLYRYAQHISIMQNDEELYTVQLRLYSCGGFNTPTLAS